MKKRRIDDDYAKTAVLERGQGRRQTGQDEADALYKEYVETTEAESSEDRTIVHHWRGSKKG
jgi:hypothetical protein